MTTILIKKKDTAGAPAPGDLTNAAGGTEIAVNTATRRIYTKDSGGNVVELGNNATSSTIADLTVTNSTTLSYGTANQVQYLNASKLLVGSANLLFDGTTLTPNALTVANAVTFTGGTANGVAYLNGSKVLTSGSALVFDGANLGIGTSAPSYKLSVAGNSATSSNILLTHNTDATGAYSRIRFQFAEGNTSIASEIRNIQRVAGASGSNLAFFTENNSGTLTEAARIDSSGNMGIGTSSPNAALELSRASADVGLYITRTGSGAADYRQFIDGGGDIRFNMVSSNAIRFFTANTERTRIDSSGNLLVGTTSVSNGNSVDSRVSIGNSSDSAMLYLKGKDNTKSSVVAVEGPGQWVAYMAANGSSSSGWSGIPAGAFGLTVAAPIAMVFATDSTERARITSSGDLLVNTTSTLAAAHQTIACTAGAGSKIPLALQVGVTTDGYTAVSLQNQAGAQGSITVNTASVSYNTTSDYRLKNITGPITTSGAYIDSLNPVEGTWKADGSTFVGLIAHEVQEASRTSVATGTKDGEQMQGMDYSSAEIIANLIAEVQSLRQRLAAAGI
jgi:hypothetical protein